MLGNILGAEGKEEHDGLRRVASGAEAKKGAVTWDKQRLGSWLNGKVSN